jgi:serine/threonine-protein kinase HipA
MQQASVDVFAGRRLSGLLSRSEIAADTFLFGYAPDCRTEDAVSLTMPVVRDQYDAMGTVHPIFEMNLPEGALRERLERSFSKAVPQFDSLSLLEIVGQSQLGRLRYAKQGASPIEMPRQSVKEILAYKGTEDLFQDLLQRFATYSGVSGVQPKVLLRDADPPLAKLTHRGATHIVKTWSPGEFPELAANEYFCMRAAHYAGIATPKVSLSQNRRFLIVERFDVDAGGSYLGFEDFCVLNGMRASGRYQASYELIAKRIGQFVSATARRNALEQFYKIVALSCALGNGDAHLKNFGVIYQHADAGVTFAPAYDIVSTLVYAPHDSLALTLGGDKRFPDRARLIAFGRQACGLPLAHTRRLLDEALGGVDQALRAMTSYARDNRDFARARDQLSKVFRAGVASLMGAGEVL